MGCSEERHAAANNTQELTARSCLYGWQRIFYWNLLRVDAENHCYVPGNPEHPGSFDYLCQQNLLPFNLLTPTEIDMLKVCEREGQNE